MKVEYSIFWDGKDIEIINKPFVIEQMKEYYQPNTYLDGTAEEQWAWKSNEQLGYLFGELGPKALLGYRSRGIKLKNKEMAVDYLMLEPEIDCTNRIIDEFTGQTLARVPKNISSMGKKELNGFMSDAILFCEVELGVTIEPPEVFKENKKFKKQ